MYTPVQKIILVVAGVLMIERARLAKPCWIHRCNKLAIETLRHRKQDQEIEEA